MPDVPVITRRGTGPDLVLLHGWGMNNDCWGPLADHLAASFTLHLVHLPGHGEGARGAWSAGDFVANVLAEVPAAPWLGWSLGGNLALAAAARDAERVRGLVLLATNPRFMAGPEWTHGAAEHVFNTVKAGIQSDTGATLERFLALMVRGSEAATRTLATLGKHVLAERLADRDALLSGLDALETVDQVRQLQSIQCAALWICGERDLVTPAAASGTAAARMPRAKYVMVRGAGHAPFLSHPDAVFGALDDFLHGAAA